jgi:hypothetical protein
VMGLISLVGGLINSVTGTSPAGTSDKLFQIFVHFPVYCAFVLANISFLVTAIAVKEKRINFLPSVKVVFVACPFYTFLALLSFSRSMDGGNNGGVELLMGSYFWLAGVSINALTLLLLPQASSGEKSFIDN